MRRHSKGIYSRKITTNATGVVGLNAATRYGFSINPIIAVQYLPLEYLLAELKEREFHLTKSGDTIALPIGYLSEPREYRDWSFEEGEDNAATVADMVHEITTVGFRYMEENVTLEAICERISKDRHCIADMNQPYRLPTGYLMLGRYAALGDRADLALAVIAVVVQVLLGLSFGLALGSAGALRTAAAATGVALLALTLSAGWGVAYEHPADPREALLREPTAMGVRDLVQTLHDLSWEQTGMPTTLEFVFEAPGDSVLAWYLRGFEMAQRVDQLGDVNRDDIGMIVATGGRDEPVSAPVDAEYTGQDFALHRQWTPRALGCRFWDSGCNVAFGWFLFRDAPPLPEAVERATLWRHVDVAIGN